MRGQFHQRYWRYGDFQVGGDASTSRKCHGDSGGPTYMKVQTQSAEKWRVVGITSHAYDESDCQKGGVDTRRQLARMD